MANIYENIYFLEEKRNRRAATIRNRIISSVVRGCLFFGIRFNYPFNSPFSRGREGGRGVREAALIGPGDAQMRVMACA